MNKTVKRVITIIIVSFTGVLLLIAIVLFILSPGKIEPYIDKNGQVLPGSLAEKTFVQIAGVRQGMFIKSKNIHNPVLLYVHGGPAFPNYFLIDKFKPGLEDYFTVCYWEQRGGGLSFSPAVTAGSMTFNQLALDAVEVTNYLRNRFGKDKIFMMAHSGGMPIALLAAARNPELYEAYIAMAQITNQAASEKIAYEYMLQQYTESGNLKRVRQLKKYQVGASGANMIAFYKSALRDQCMHELGIGTMHKMNSIFWDIFIPGWTCKAYTIPEKINTWKSKFSFLPKTNLVNELLETDFTAEVSQLDIPVYFLSGNYDFTVNTALSKAYLAQLRAPIKQFYSFHHSAHSPLFEEPGLVRQLIEKQVLGNMRSAPHKVVF